VLIIESHIMSLSLRQIAPGTVAATSPLSALDWQVTWHAINPDGYPPDWRSCAMNGT
jgi:hypothetical protein